MSRDFGGLGGSFIEGKVNFPRLMGRMAYRFVRIPNCPRLMGCVAYRLIRIPNCFRFFLLCDQKKKPNKKENVTQRRGAPLL